MCGSTVSDELVPSDQQLVLDVGDEAEIEKPAKNAISTWT
jgi:hypothetical protein